VAQAAEVGQAFHENLIGKARQNLRIFFTMPLQGNLNSYDLNYMISAQFLSSGCRKCSGENSSLPDILA
jgi:hypothetical protein